MEVSIRTEDLKVDTYRAGGAGGRTSTRWRPPSASPISRAASSSSARRSGPKVKNRAKAMKVLLAKLAGAERERAESHKVQSRRSQVGTGDRSEKIRTYNFPQNRVTDHRLERSWHSLPEILEGRVDPVLEALREESAAAGPCRNLRRSEAPGRGHPALETAKVPEARANAEWILAAVLKCGRGGLGRPPGVFDRAAGTPPQ